MPTFLQAALSYATLGWPVFPLKHLSKTPATPRGFYDATTQTSQINAWWKTDHHNIGIRTGDIGGDDGSPRGLFVLDIDPRNGGATSLDRLVAIHGDGLLHTLHCTTGGGGSHYYYSYPAASGREDLSALWKGSLAQGIDLKGIGGYVVAPPSITTGEYRWEGGDPRDGIAPREAPAFILSILAERHKEKMQRPPLARETPEQRRQRDGQIYEGTQQGQGKELDQILLGAPQGERNSRAASLCGLLWHKFRDKSIVTSLMISWNQKNSPPLAHYELMTVIKSVSRYHS